LGEQAERLEAHARVLGVAAVGFVVFASASIACPYGRLRRRHCHLGSTVCTPIGVLVGQRQSVLGVIVLKSETCEWEMIWLLAPSGEPISMGLVRRRSEAPRAAARSRGPGSRDRQRSARGPLAGAATMR
jgi:hypothetical protein